MLFTAFVVGHMVTIQGSFTIVRSNDGLPKKPGTYLVPSKEDLSQPVYEIKGNNKTIDLKGIVLRGSGADVEPDQREGPPPRITGRPRDAGHRDRQRHAGVHRQRCPRPGDEVDPRHVVRHPSGFDMVNYGSL